jgi:hypothetical protein
MSGYILRVWLLTILVGPLLFIVLMIVRMSDPIFQSGMAIAQFYLLSVVFGASFSMPTLIVILLLSFFEFKIKDTSKLKAYFMLVSIICMTITLLIFFDDEDLNTNTGIGSLTLALLYGIPIIVFGLIFKIKKKD